LAFLTGRSSLVTLSPIIGLSVEFSADERDHGGARPLHGTGSATRLIVAASLGNALEFYEILIYGYFAVTIAKVFFPTANDVVSIIMATAFLSFAALVILRQRAIPR
jgi:hypothetical protein